MGVQWKKEKNKKMTNFKKSQLRAIIKESLKELILENRDACNEWENGSLVSYNGFMTQCCDGVGEGCITTGQPCSVFYGMGISFLNGTDPCECCRYYTEPSTLDCNESPTGKCWGCRGQGSACEQLDQIPMSVTTWQTTIGNPLYPDLLACQAGISNGEACGDSGRTNDNLCQPDPVTGRMPRGWNEGVECFYCKSPGPLPCTDAGFNAPTICAGPQGPCWPTVNACNANSQCNPDRELPCEICCCKEQGAPIGEQIRRYDNNPGPSEPVGGCASGTIVNALFAPTMGECSCDALSGYMQIPCGPSTPPTNHAGISESAMKNIVKNMLKTLKK